MSRTKPVRALIGLGFGALVFVAGAVDRAIAQDVPTIKLQYRALPFEVECEALTRYRYEVTKKDENWKIGQGWSDELASRVAEFQSYWDAESSALLQTAMQEVGKPFPHREMLAALTLCNVMSMSSPLIIQARRFLNGPTNGKPLEKMFFTALVFHELLHSYIFAHRPPTTPTLIEYKALFDEHPVARTHVHLFALMKVVYGKLGRSQDFEAIIRLQAPGSSPAYKMAWELVEKVGADRLVAELKGQ